MADTLFPNPSGPYETGAQAYRDAGMGPISLPRKKKWPPMEGCTGDLHRGVYVETDADIRAQADYHRGGNVAVRLPEHVVGIDVDVRNAGDTTIAMKESALGPLPPTLYSTSRDDGSRIAFYRVPPGLRWKDVGDGVETIWWGSRYAVSWPSVHPDTGQVYHLFTADDVRLPGVPKEGWDLAADLPQTWIDAHVKADEEGDEPVDLPVIHPAEVRRRLNGVLRWLGEAKDGERNKRIYDVGCVVGGLWAQLPEGCTDEDLDEDTLKDLVRKVFADIGVEPDERKAKDTLDRGWETGVRNPAANLPLDFVVEEAAPGPGRRLLRLEVTNPEAAYKQTCKTLGTGSLSGVFRRDGSLVHTPRVGEDGYVPPEGKREYDDGTVRYDDDGPAQVRRLDGPGLRAFVAHHAEVFKMVTPQGSRVAVERAAVLPADTAALLIGSPHYVTGARPLRAVAHTPLVLADGSVLSEPGYDERSGVLYLPEIEVPVPRGVVTRAQADEAVAMLDLMLDGFPFVTPDDHATFLAALLTPLLREVAPPPYPLVAIGAPSPGSGKSYLAWVLREVHGGVFRAEMPRYDEELRKQITTILDQTTGPVVTFDNLSGTFASARFDSLLTSNEWTDRLLGGNQEVTLTNDRLWTVTGNNLTFGGDMRRRVRWVTIDTGLARPEERTDFKIDLKPWVREHRGDLLGALLTLVVGWVQSGQPLPRPDRSDDFTRWTRVTQGVLAWAGVPGKVGGAVRDGGLEEADDAEVLAMLRRVFGTGEGNAFTAAQVVTVTSGSYGLREEELAALLPRPARGGPPNAKSLGHWLSRWQDRPTEAGATLRKTGGRWWFEWDLI